MAWITPFLYFSIYCGLVATTFYLSSYLDHRKKIRASFSEKELPFVSVIIPAFNAGQFITRTLNSVANQTYSNFEIVITNDGSLDNTEAVITEYIQAHPSLQIHLSSQINKGIGSARNNGIFRARGKYLAFLDADDCWYENKLERVYEI